MAEKLPEVHDHLEEARADILAFTAFPKEICEPWVCYNDRCPVVVGSTVTYRDLDHLTATYAGRLARPLGRELGLWPE